MLHCRELGKTQESWADAASNAKSRRRQPDRSFCNLKRTQENDLFLLLVPVFAQALLALMGRNLFTFTFTSRRHRPQNNRMSGWSPGMYGDADTIRMQHTHYEMGFP